MLYLYFSKKKIINLILILKFIIIFLFFYNLFYTYYQIVYINNSKLEKEYQKLENYFKICIRTKLKNYAKIKKNNFPKVSIISPVYNREKYILRFLRSIQNQKFKDIEIIFIDDCSRDNSVNIIEELKKEDERIIFIKNKRRKGTLICRNLGVFISKGKFLLFVDPDDLISENILNYFDLLTKKFDYDLIRFNLYMGHYDLNLPEIVHFLKCKTIYKPNIFSHLFYGFGKLLQLDFYITNKLIKRKLFIRVLNSINKYYLESFMIDCEDGLINFMLYKLGESYYFTRKIGYYYIVSKESITHPSVDFKKRLKSNFLYFRFIFQSTKNNNKEKKIASYIFFFIYNRHHCVIINLLKNLYRDFQFYLGTINLYLHNEFIPFIF